MHLEMNELEEHILSPMQNGAARKASENNDSIHKQHLGDSAAAAIASSLSTQDRTRILNETSLWRIFSSFIGVFDVSFPK